MTSPRLELESYPGGDLVRQGLADLERGVLSEEALLVSIAAPRLQGLGLDVCPPTGVEPPYEHALFAEIERRNLRGAHSDYNALIGRIVSFAQAYERGG